MRRARIKAVATLPARRKATREFTEESAEPANPVSNEKTDNKPTIAEIASRVENPKENVIEAPNFPTAIEEKTEKSQPSEIITQNTNSPIQEQNKNDIPERITNPPESPIKDRTNQQKQTLLRENSSEEIKIPPQNETSVPKISQTRTSFMRPIPRLDGGGRMRRNSIQGSGASASESEDDCRRSSTVHPTRVRNDSLNSAQSPKGQTLNSITSNSSNLTETSIAINAGNSTANPKNSSSLSLRQKRKMVVSESARKLAEARREFLLKHENKEPDRTKLRMYDLIYYNPITNPMKKSDGSRMDVSRTPATITPDSEDDEDDNVEAEGEAMPVPQVKVGPDGSLMIDEQSLVIEHTGAKKSRQAMARTEALVDDDNNGSGFYKKRQKSKDWPKWETLKFYKALSSIGTDFLLMQNLFPKRTRGEIKMKYKKEEKNNPKLVEKALTYPQEFNIDSLKEDLATFEEPEKRKNETAKVEKRPASRQGGRVKKKKNKPRRIVATSIEMESMDEFDEASETASIVDSRIEQKKVTQRRSANNESWTKSDAVSSSEDSASDTEIYQVKPTRSGRKPKVRKLQAPTINTLDNSFSDVDEEVKDPSNPDISSARDQEADCVMADNSGEDHEMAEEEIPSIENAEILKRSQSVHDSLAGISQVEPGSLVIVSRESAEAPGETVLQVYMVSSDIDDGSGLKQNMTPVVLTPELLNTVAAGITKVEPIDVHTE